MSGRWNNGNTPGPPVGHQPGSQMVTVQHHVSVSSASNGVVRAWAGTPMPDVLPSQAIATHLEGDIRSALGRVLRSRALGVASLASGGALATAVSLAVWVLGAPLFLLGAFVPAAVLITVGAGLTMAGRRSVQNVSEGQILESAQRRGGTLTVATLALDARRPMAECQKALDSMVVAGWMTMDVDDNGLLTYRIAALSPPLLR